MALSGVRSSWLMVARNSALGGVGALGLGARVFERLLLLLALGDVAHHRDHLAARRSSLAGRLVERAAAHLDPDEFVAAAGCAAAGIAPHAEFDRAGLAARRGIRQRREIGRAVGDMHAIEQAVAEQLAAPWRRTAARPPARRTAPRRCGRAA